MERNTHVIRKPLSGRGHSVVAHGDCASHLSEVKAVVTLGEYSLISQACFLSGTFLGITFFSAAAKPPGAPASSGNVDTRRG